MRTMIVVGFIFSVAILCAALTSCASLDQQMYNSSGQSYHCKSQGWGIVGTLNADSQQKQCIQQAQSLGYK